MCSQVCVTTLSDTNARPVAEAGANQFGQIGVELSFDGSASTDGDNDELSYQWSLVEFPAGSQAQLTGNHTPAPSLTADLEGIYTLQLIVSDGITSSEPDLVRMATPGMLLDGAPDDMVVGTDGIVYLASASNSLIYRWSLEATFPLEPLSLEVGYRLMAYSPDRNRLYLGYDDGTITMIDLTAGIAQTPFANTPLAPNGLASVGNFVLAADASGAWHTHYIFDSNGTLVTSAEWNRYSKEYAWSRVHNRVYFFRDGTSPNDLHYEEIDQATGLFTGRGETPYHGDYSIRPPIRVSKDGARVLLGSGDLYDAVTLEWAGSLTIELVDAAWMDAGLLTLRNSPDGRTLLEQWSDDFVLNNTHYYNGQPLRILEWQGGRVVVTLVNGRLAFHTFTPNLDGDGDGVPYSQDAFPMDPAASVDSDGDGYPDAWNPGQSQADSTTGLVLDAFPDDSACQLPSHGLPSDPTVCDIANGIPDYTPDRIVVGSDDVVYLLSAQNEKVFRWSLQQGAHLNPIHVDDAPQLMAYAPADHRIYLGHANGAITVIDLAAGVAQAPFAVLPLPPHGLASVGNFVLAADASGAWNTHYIFDGAGTLVDSADWNYRSRDYAWNSVHNRVYFFRDNSSPNDLHYEEIDQTTGLITADGETPYHGDYSIRPPIRVSDNGALVLLGSGDWYDAETLVWAGSLPVDPLDAAWMDAGLLTLRDSPDGGTLLEQWGADYTLNNVQRFDGQPLRILEQQGGYAVITLLDGQPAFNFYAPTDDGDGDGVPFSQDAFPLDPAASVDSDGDGYPDAWNPGQSQADSTTGLVLDAFPDDSSCQLASHGLPSDPTVCDIANGIPDYTPDQIVVGSDDVVYLLSAQSQKVFRWSLQQGAHLNPIHVDDAPQLMAYAPADHRIYLGHANGAINFIDLATGVAQAPFATLPLAPHGLASVGNYMMAADASGSGNTHYIFDGAGALVDSVDWNERSREYAWNSVHNRVYFFRDGISPNDLHYEDIDQATGLITGQGETPYHGSFSIIPPIRVSRDGAMVLLGSGDLYDALTLAWDGSLPIDPVDAVWMETGLLTLIDSPDGRTLLEQRGADRTLNNVQLFDGQPLRILEQQGGYVVITLLDGQPAFYFYMPNEDGDGDGVPYSQDAFPLDPAASLDSDRDGYPDAWNPGQGQADSTTGLALDAFPDDSACQLASQGLPSDPTVCNIAGTIPDYTPDRIVMGSDHVVYLLSTASDKVFRWSMQDTHLNPIYVDDAPQLMAYAPADQRLYLAYANGAINFIDLAAGVTQSSFAATPLPPHGLASVGNFVLAADASGAWNTHYIFDGAGALVASEDWNQRSSEYAWNHVHNRVYFFSSATITSGLRYEDIDPATGLITGDGASAYNGSGGILQLIRVSKDGAVVLNGSGSLYDAVTLEHTDSLIIDPLDAAWMDAGLLTLRDSPDGGTLLEQWGADYTLNNVQRFDGQPLRILEQQGGYAVITLLDGQPAFNFYAPTDDGDGDGVPFSQDAFPLDPAAAVDSDGDGYPDAWNPGQSQADSTTGLTLDAFPDDSACQLPSHGLPADPTVCDIANGIPVYTPDQIVAGTDDVVYLLSTENNRIYRWSYFQNYHLNPIDVDDAPQLMAYAPADHRIYLGYDSGAIHAIDLNNGTDQSYFGGTPEAPHGLASVGAYLLAADSGGGWNTHYIYAADGRFITSMDMNRRSREYAWNAALSRVYFFRDGTSPNDLHYEEIDQATGLITDEGDSPYHGAYSILPPIRVSKAGDKVLLGSGDVYDAVTLERLDSMYIEPIDAIWMDAGLLTLRSSPDGRTLLEQWGGDLTLHGFVYFDGQPLRVLELQDGYAVVTLVNGQPVFQSYTPNDDVDGDGVFNWQDAFPLDPAASMDSDGDGYPDAWNPGQSQADSTAGLVLDAFPDDSACQLPSHGLPSDPTVCDIANGIPDYTPDRIVVGGDDVVYLLSSANDTVFRWSLVEGYHLNPIHLDGAPQLMTYSPEQHRLYLAYENGAITFIDLSTGITQSPFATTPMAPHGLASVGNFMLAADGSGAWNTHYIFDGAGALVTSEDWNRRSREYAWNSIHNRVYFFRDGTSPNDLHYEEIDQATGLITGDGETPYHSSLGIQPPIRVSKDGSRVLLGSGNMYDAISMAQVGTLSVAPVDAAWTDTGLLTMRQSPDGRTLLEQWDAGYALQHSQYFDGQPLRILEWQGGYSVVSLEDNRPVFVDYQVN